MKNKLMILALVIMSNAAFAQTPSERSKASKENYHQKMMEMRINYVRENLVLNDGEMEKFIPIYKEKLEKITAIRKDSKQASRDLRKNIESLTEAEVDARMKKKFETQQEVLNIEKEYYEKFKKVTSAKNLVTLQSVERKFQMDVMKKASEARQSRMNVPASPKEEGNSQKSK